MKDCGVCKYNTQCGRIMNVPRCEKCLVVSKYNENSPCNKCLAIGNGDLCLFVPSVQEEV